MNATEWLQSDGAKAIEQAIQKAETETRCEFVCAVATRSAPYAKSGYFWSLVGAVFGFLLGGSLAHGGHSAGSWDYLHTVPVAQSLFGMIVGFLAATLLALRYPWLGPPFVSKEAQAQAVERAAAYLFGKHQVSHTEERVGVLLYLSLSERQFVVLADRAVKKVLGEEGLAQLIKTGTSELAAGQKAPAFVKTLEAAAAALEDDFPRPEDDENELSDQIIVIHPYP